MAIPSTPTQEYTPTAPGAGSASSTLTITSLAAGNTIFIYVHLVGGTQTVSSITCTNVTFTLQQATPGNLQAQRCEIWMGVVAGGASGTSVQINFSANLTSAANCAGSSWPGLYTLDVHSSTSGNSTTPDTAAFTPTSGQNQLQIAMARRGGTFSTGPTGGFTAFNTGNATRVAAYLVVGSTSGTNQCTWTFTAALGWECCYATFSQAASGTAFSQSVGGTLTPAGAITNRTSRALAGALVPAGAIARTPARALSAALTPSGTIGGRLGVVLAGAMAASGALVSQYNPGGGVVTSVLLFVRERRDRMRQRRFL